MQIYEISQQLAPVDNIGDKPVVIIIREIELADNPIADFSAAMILPWRASHFCKAELYADHLVGTFFMPQKHDYLKAKSGDTVRITIPLRCSFVITARGVLFADDDNTLSPFLSRLLETRMYMNGSILTFFGNLLTTLIEADMAHFSGMQLRIVHLEKNVMNGIIDKFNHQIMPLRKEIMAFSRYYSQLIDIGQQLLEYAAGKAAKSETALLRAFMARAGRLRDEAQALREYSNQVRDIYQSEINIRQNQIMKLFTVVTTIFMPLTLVVGWYGMNFENMPELHWEFGYPFAGALCLAIVIILLWVFTKKKYW